MTLDAKFLVAAMPRCAFSGKPEARALKIQTGRKDLFGFLKALVPAGDVGDVLEEVHPVD